MYVQYVLFYLDVFNFLLIFCTRNYIHCDEKPVRFRLIFKYLRTFKIIIEDNVINVNLHLILRH